jgi:signal peptidase I
MLVLWREGKIGLTILFVMFIVLGIIFGARFSLLVATVVSTSMSPTLEIGDRVLALRHWPACWLRKGQIVLLWPPEDYRIRVVEQYGAIPLIKRVVGLPDDKFVVTRVPLSKNMNNNIHTEELKIPLKHFVVKGDLEIAGSAPLTIGPIPFDNLLALVVMKLPQKDRIYGMHGVISTDADNTKLD